MYIVYTRVHQSVWGKLLRKRKRKLPLNYEINCGNSQNKRVVRNMGTCASRAEVEIWLVQIGKVVTSFLVQYVEHTYVMTSETYARNVYDATYTEVEWVQSSTEG